MKTKSKTSSGKVRESVATYRTERKPSKCRELTGKELADLAEKMVEAHERGDKTEWRRIRKALINGFYGEVRA
jgi:hypothetical protein